MVLGEVGRGPGVRRAVARRAGRRRARPSAPVDAQDIVVCASGNLALLYLTWAEGRIEREAIDDRYPELIPGLLAHDGVALVLVHSRDRGPLALGRAGEHELESGRIRGNDPLVQFGPEACASLLRMDGFANTGDIIVLGPFDAGTGEVVSYEDLVGSHGGLGGWQEQPFILHPAWLPLDHGPLVGAPAVHLQLRRWLTGRYPDPEGGGLQR